MIVRANNNIATKPHLKPDRKHLQRMVPLLAHHSGNTRRRTRVELIRCGSAISPILLEFLDDGRKIVRWEVAKVLVEVADEQAAEKLVAAQMQEPDADVRWILAETVSRLGHHALPPILSALIKHPSNDNLLNMAHYVMRHLMHTQPEWNDVVEQASEALISNRSPTSTSRAAYEALLIYHSKQFDTEAS